MFPPFHQKASVFSPSLWFFVFFSPGGWVGMEGWNKSIIERKQYREDQGLRDHPLANQNLKANTYPTPPKDG
jgi:hypothetical protein